MFLRRVTLTGFKSFANKTVLNLEPGITAIVGPNGSGKSNLADAVRWALGEQGKGRLRLGDREDVVFAGTATRAKASFAEVVLLFDNEDGAFPLDLTEVEISRRLYRSGESDYRLAGRSVALRDIQALLAEAGFGASTYAVIGQGMIDSFLLSSPAERKLLFDEAAGIRGPELGREAALRKLSATSANLVRLRDIVAELEPRLASLERSVAAESQQRAAEARVGELRQAVVAAGFGHWSYRHDELSIRLRTASHRAHQLRHETATLDRALRQEHARAADASREYDRLQDQLATLEHDRDELQLELAETRGRLAEAQRSAGQVKHYRDQLTAARHELAEARERSDELVNQLASNAESAVRAAKAVERAGRDVADAQAALVAIRQGTADGSRDQYIMHALDIVKTIAIGLDSSKLSDGQVRLLVHKAGRLLSHAQRNGTEEILTALKTAQKKLETTMGKREVATEHQTNVTISTRSLEIDLAHQQTATRRLEDQVATVEAELAGASTAMQDLAALQRQIKALEGKLATAVKHLEDHRLKLHHLSADTQTAQRQAELATAAERARAAAQTVQTEQLQAQAGLAEAADVLAAVRRQAHEWSVPTDGAVPAEPLTQLQSELVRAEALLEAKVVTQREHRAEYEEVSTRHAELTAQITDLETASADLERVVAELDQLIRARFTENFEALAEQFSNYFGRLFAGGAASLELETNDDGSYGIVIKASPAGKRPVSLAALSGGERSLAGVALLAAILRVNPSPFVVLDEIDAALDEANSGRLSSILEELQQHSQLIVITHNRQTMRVARVLFGVTVGEHHVSHLLSMRLEDATQLAAR